jgi:hypothetical protein
MNPHLRLVKKDIRWFGAGAREYCTAPLNSPVIQAPLIHKENRDLLYLCHNYVNKARMEAQFISDQFNAMAKSENKNPDDQAEPRTLYHRKTSRTILYRYFPPVIRSFIIFFYRLIFKTDFRDGWIGILHAFFFGLWYHILIDFMFVEIKMNMKRESKKRKVRF